MGSGRNIGMRWRGRGRRGAMRGGEPGGGEFPTITVQMAGPFTGNYLDGANDSTTGKMLRWINDRFECGIDINAAADVGGDGAVFVFFGAAENLIGVGLVDGEGGASSR